jgi:hypothetical protein
MYTYVYNLFIILLLYYMYTVSSHCTTVFILMGNYSFLIRFHLMNIFEEKQ